MPTVESADAGFITLGIQVRGYHDFGVAKQEGSAARVEKVPFRWRRGEVTVA